MSGNLTCVLVFTALFVNLEQTMCGGFFETTLKEVTCLVHEPWDLGKKIEDQV